VARDLPEESTICNKYCTGTDEIEVSEKDYLGDV
jgi:hypothetical protein